jgi:EmrB/QacA subfamily drug resistance transporter
MGQCGQASGHRPAARARPPRRSRYCHLDDIVPRKVVARRPATGKGGVTQEQSRSPAEREAAPRAEEGELLRYRSAAGRWTLAAVVLGSGAAFLESSVVSLALPAIGREFHLELGGLQWVVNAYLIALGALIVFGGSLGDQYGRRRVFVLGAVGFCATSVLCAVAPSSGFLIAARVLQGVAGAMMVPGSLAIVEASFHPDDRGQAIGAWAGWAGISTAIGPFLGGALVDSGSWRFVFLTVVLVAGPAAFIALRHVPESRDMEAGKRPDWLGAALISAALAGLVYALVEAGGRGLGDPLVATIGGLGLVLLLAFVLVERRTPQPLVPFDLFRSRQFTGANLATLANYFALGGAFFFLSLELQTVVGYSALEAGAATFPAIVMMLLLSPQAGKLGQRVGPRLPMTIGPLVAAVGFVLLAQLGPHSTFVRDVLPGILVFGLGLTIFVAPLTTAVLAAVPDHQAGLASALSNAVARLAQLGSSAVLPLAAGLGASTAVGPGAFSAGFSRAMLICAGAAVVGAAVSFATVRRTLEEPIVRQPSPSQGCQPTSRRPPVRTEAAPTERRGGGGPSPKPA